MFMTTSLTEPDIRLSLPISRIAKVRPKGINPVRHALFDHIPAACPLCLARVPGRRLCIGCESDLHRLEGVGCSTSETSDTSDTSATSGLAGDARPRLRCPRCGARCQTAGAPCWDCLRLPPPYRRTIVAMSYVAPYDGLIGLLKHHHKLWMAECLARLLAHVMHREIEAGDLVSPALLLPIPASRASLMRRGFNPAGELARALGWRLAVPVRHGLLVRTREGPKQAELGRIARLRESVDLFAARGPLTGLHVGLVDDVMTTGGTLAAAAHAVLDQGAASVTLLVAARTP